jgi:3-oxo-5-alpha-steroid 4-dehydrogenase 1
MSELQVYTTLLYTVFIAAAFIFIVLYFITAPYGRHSRGGWGIAIDARTGWIIMELPAVLAIAACFLSGNKADIVSIVFLCIWELHYIQRTFIFPFLMRSSVRNFPVLLTLFAITFNVINGYVNGSWLFRLAPSYDASWLIDPRFIAGLAVFLAGFVINIHSDHVLRTLRAPGETGYKIPYGGMYRFVSSPNYMGEILEWTGWAILTWSLAGLSFAVFTAANLVPRAHANHIWYKEKFSDYPEERRVIVPFIY